MSWSLSFANISVNRAILVLVLLVLFSAVAVVYTKHLARSSFVVLQQLEKQRDALNETWGRLLLEQSTLGSPSRVKEIAQKRLQMRVPEIEKIVVVQP